MNTHPNLHHHEPQILQNIAQKIYNNERLTIQDGITLYRHADIGFVGTLANYVRQQKHGDKTYFNRNFHIEPTNICVYDCKFCSYSRLIRQRNEGWELSAQEMMDIVKQYDNQPVTEVHIVGGVLPQMNLHFFGELIKNIKQYRPQLHIKAFTAVEYFYMFKKAKVNNTEGFQYLKQCGLDSIPGGGAEIFDPEIRQQICPDKCTGEQWLQIHQAAHQQGIPSNCTMLYGHLETPEHRIHHMNQLRTLQDQTQGFNCFIPLKFRNQNNQLSHLPEVSVIEDLKNYAIARLFLDNIPHLKAYWPMIGRNTAQLSLAFGVNDLDGTINDTTKIYTMAGSEEQNPSLSTQELVELITAVQRHPIERDSLYNLVTDYKNTNFEHNTPKYTYIELPVIKA